MATKQFLQTVRVYISQRDFELLKQKAAEKKMSCEALAESVVHRYFTGELKNSSAAQAGLQINHVVREINTAIKAAYPTTTYTLRQAIGIDTSELFVAKTGIRLANDLLWVGRAANYAAKLCSLGNADYPIHITESVFDKLNEDSKSGGTPRRCMWEKALWKDIGIVIYRSNWYWPF